MSDFPNRIDDDVTLPPANDNLTEDRAEIINAGRDAIFNIETEIGIGASGTTGSIANRLDAFSNPNGTLKPSAINSLLLDYTQLQINNNQVLENADIVESKLLLDYKTQDLFNFITDLSRSVNTSLDWINLSGVKLEPHLLGQIYRHTLDQINVSSSTSQYLKNRFGILRDNSQSYNVLADINSDFVAHQLADGTVSGSFPTVITNNGSTYPSSFAHTASGIYLDTSLFSLIPHTATNLQALAEFVDSANILLLGTKVQTQFQNGIPRSSRATSLGSNSQSTIIVPDTAATAFQSSTMPLDDSFSPFGDDVILLNPSGTALTGNVLYSQLLTVKPGDVANINYGSVIASFIVKEVNPSQFTIRIAGKNLLATTNALVSITKALTNKNKYGVLAPAIAPSPSNSIPSSLIIGSPRGAEATGIGFNASLLDSTHYRLYLQLYPTGDPAGGNVTLVSVDVTGNQGATPGAYTLDSIVENVNATFRNVGYNFRFIAFEYQGEFGIMLAEDYGQASFSIVSGIPSISGSSVYDVGLTNTIYPFNVIDVVNGTDPLGLGPNAGNWASPPFNSSFSSTAVAMLPTIIIRPLQRKFYLVNGGESDHFATESGQILDFNGDSYWPATITNKTIGGSSVQVTYHIAENLTGSRLAVGKTLVVQPENNNGLSTDFGRFTIQNVVFNSTCTPDGYVFSTDITVYDAVHGTGISPYLTSNVGTAVRIYFNSDSVGFNTENVNDVSQPSTTAYPFKRNFEIYLDQDGYTFSHERGRFSLSGAAKIVNNIPFYGGAGGNLSAFNMVSISPKMTGYPFTDGQYTINKINLQIISYSSSTGVYDGYLCRCDSNLALSHIGGTVTGKIGEVVRFYDETNIDYIDFILELGSSPIGPSLDGYGLDIQLFTSLQFNDEIFLLATCQYNDSSGSVSKLKDKRQFGNISEQQLSDSALDFINAVSKYTQQNGVIRGFDVVGTSGGTISLKGGVALTNGSIRLTNQDTVTFPIVKELYLSTLYNINWLLCAGVGGQFSIIPMTDFDSVLVTPSVGDRVVTLQNMVTSGTYNVDSTTFDNLLNFHKDLVPLYIVSSTVTGTGGSATVSSINVQDVRKYVVDENSLFTPTLTDQNTQGNFRSISSAINWFKYNATYQNSLNIKSSHILDTDPGFSINPLTVNGDGYLASLNLTVASTMTKTNFVNIGLVFNSSASFDTVTVNNCTVSFSGLATLNSTTFTNCTVTFAAGASFTNVTFTNCTVNFNAGTFSTNTLAITGSVVSLATSFAQGSNLTIIDSQVTVTSTRAFELGSNYRFERDTFTYAPPSPVGDGTYVSSNLLNVSNGMMHINIGIGGDGYFISDLTVKNCTFTTALSDHYGFFSFRFNHINSYIRNVTISGNRFLSTSVTNDIRAVIAFTSTTAVNGSGQATTGASKSPALINVFITNNYCNHDQMIAITSIRNNLGAGLNTITGPLLLTTNCRISGNTCGTISFIVAAQGPYVGSNADFLNTPVRNKTSQLVINENTCKLITNLDSLGQYISFRLTFPDGGGGTYSQHDLVNIGTGAYTISNNTANWIQVGCSSYGQYTNGSSTVVAMQDYDGATIVDNMLSPADPSFLRNYDDAVNDATHTVGIMGNYGITLRRESSTQGNTKSIISGNKIIQKPTQTNSGGTITTFYYDQAIVCLNSALVTNNVVSGVLNTSSSANASMLVLWTTGSIIVSNNMFDRGLFINQNGLSAPNNGNTILTYIWAPNGTSTNLVRITNNIFDSRYVDQANTIENSGQSGVVVGTTISVPWTFSDNKNQVAYVAIPLCTESQPDSLTNTFPPGEAIVVNSTGDYVYPNYKITLVTSTGTTGAYAYAVTRSLHTYLPKNVTLLGTKIGINFSGTATFGGGSNFIFHETFVYPTLGNNFTAGTGSAADPTNGTALATFNSSLTSTIGLGGTPVYNSLDYSGSTQCATFPDRYITLRVLFKYAFSAVTSGATFNISPILVKFIW